MIEQDLAYILRAFRESPFASAMRAFSYASLRSILRLASIRDLEGRDPPSITRMTSMPYSWIRDATCLMTNSMHLDEAEAATDGIIDDDDDADADADVDDADDADDDDADVDDVNDFDDEIDDDVDDDVDGDGE